MTFDFIKKLFLGIGIAVITCFMPFIYPANAAAEISSVSYVHKTIKNMKNLDVPIPFTAEPKQINSVAYLMRQIDDANEILNGMRTTDYFNSDLAVSSVMATTATDRYIDELIKKLGTFEFTVADVNSFDFQISASGYFTLDWGDGIIDRITKTNTTNTTYSHTYPATGNYTIRIFGKATGYNSYGTVAAISFNKSAAREKVTSITGGLGQIFPTLPDGKNPSFYGTFAHCTGLSGSIPSDLFDGVSGKPVPYMFTGTFQNCNSLTGSIPSGLFAGISGAPTEYMFSWTFQDCSGLTGSIPSDLFAGIKGAPAPYMFNRTFYSCKNLNGSIPEGLFSGIKGAPKEFMFNAVFYECENLTGSIPANLFAGISGAPAESMFAHVFAECPELSGSIPAGLFSNISGAPADTMFGGTFQGCSGLTGSIPSGLFGNISGAPAADMFHAVFNKCSNLTGSIPSGLFGNISGTPAPRMFKEALQQCDKLTGTIPANLFGTFSGSPAEEMFSNTFYYCRGLTGIESAIWDMTNVTNSAAADPFLATFEFCSNITSSSPTIAAGSNVKLWQHFTSINNQGTFKNATRFADYDEIPDDWK